MTLQSQRGLLRRENSSKMSPCAYPEDNNNSVRSEETDGALPPSLALYVKGALPQVDSATLERLLAQWRLEQGRRNRGLWQIAVLALIIGICIFIGNAMNWSSLLSAAIACGGLMILMPFGIEAVTLSVNGTSGLFERLQRALQEIDDVRAVGALLDLLYAGMIFEPLPTELAVVPALTRVLALLDEAAVEHYLRPHSDRLYFCLRWIEPAQHSEYVIAALRLLPSLNDRPALICAAWYVIQEAPTNKERYVREVAGISLAALLAKVDLGGPVALPDWINRLPFGDVTLDWKDLLAPLAVLQTLPQISAADYMALDYRSRRRLYASLISMDLRRLHTDYTLAVLDLVQRAGDVEALSVVRQLQMASRRSVRTMAKLCLPILEARQERERIGRTLLRSSGLPPEPVDSLLRPAISGAPDDPQLLLRGDVKAHEHAEFGDQRIWGSAKRKRGTNRQRLF